MTNELKPLGLVRELILACGYDISYAYDDLVFGNHSLFILQFKENNPYILSLFINTACEENEATLLTHKLIYYATDMDLKVEPSGTFTLTQREEEEMLDIIFHPLYA